MARLPRPPKATKPSTKAKSSGAKSKKRARKAVGALGAGILGALGGLFGGSIARGAAAQLDAAGGVGGGSKGAGKANYGPLPSFTVQSKSVRKYNNPTLATISMQMGMLLKEMGLVESALLAQFKQQQFAYAENARAQREINAESRGQGFVPFSAPDGEGAQLGSLSVKQLNDSYLKFGKALDDATDALNNMDCSYDGSDIDIPFLPTGDLPIGKDGKRTRRSQANVAKLVEAGKGTRFISAATALDKKGLLKAGYEAVFNKRTGAVAGYREAAGWGGRWARKAGFFSPGLGKAAEGISGGINAAGRAVSKYAITPAASLINRSTQFLKGLATSGATSVSQSAFTKGAARFIKGGINLAKRTGAAIKTGAKALGRFALRKGLTIAIIAYEGWNVYQEIKSLPADLTPRQRKNAIAKIIGKFVSSVGLIWAGATIGTLLGTAVPGPGWLVGFLGGLIGGLAADFFFGNSIDELVDMVIDTLYPADKEVAKKVPTAKKEAPMPAPMANSAQGEGNVPFKKPAAAGGKPGIDAALKAAPKETVGTLMASTATRVGVDPALMNMIASENNAFNPKKQVQAVNGSEIFKLTPQQWSYITSQYGPKYPELYAGINDPKAATTAGALLIKDSQEFLTKNNIPASPLSIYGSYLFGYEGLRKLLNAPTSEVAAAVLPDAARAKPELFKDMSGDVTVGTLVQKLYNRTLPEKQKITTPQGAPAIPPATTPKVDGLPPQQSTPPSPTPSATDGGSPPTSAAPAPASPAPSSGGAAATPAAPGTSQVPAGEMVPSSPAQAVPPSPTAGPGAAVDAKTRELEKQAQDVQATSEQPVVIRSPSGRRIPEILPSQNAGYTGTGNVPEPYYIFMDQYESQIRFSSSPVATFARSSRI